MSKRLMALIAMGVLTLSALAGSRPSQASQPRQVDIVHAGGTVSDGDIGDGTSPEKRH